MWLRNSVTDICKPRKRRVSFLLRFPFFEFHLGGVTEEAGEAVRVIARRWWPLTLLTVWRRRHDPELRVNVFSAVVEEDWTEQALCLLLVPRSDGISGSLSNALYRSIRPARVRATRLISARNSAWLGTRTVSSASFSRSFVWTYSNMLYRWK
jgi:hypothetical protein